MVLEGILLGMFAALAWGAADYTTTVVSRGGGNFPVLLAAHGAAIVFMTLVLVAFVDAPALTGGEWAACLSLGLLSVATYWSLFRALELGPLAIVSPVLAGWAVVTVTLALVVLKEPLGGVQALGCAAIVVGVVLAAMRLGGSVDGAPRTRTGVLFALGAMLGLGLYNFFIGDLSQDLGWFMPLFVSRAAGVGVMVAIAARGAQWPWRHLEPRPLVAAMLVAGVGATLGAMAFNRGAEVASISVTSSAAAIYPVFPVAAGLLLLRERIAASQGAGLVLIVAGLLVLGLGS
jgi:drug/metabolite transporter (DMT)-like permease